MGSGKSSGAINYINKSDDEIKFLYITPYLDEVERIILSCPTKHFKQPKEFGSKLKGIKYLFNKGENIASTHSLFTLFDEEIIDMVYNNNYVLIMDEVIDVIEPLVITESDLENILEKYAVIENSLLKWTNPKYKGKFDDYKRLCSLDCIGIYNDKVVLWLFPISVFRAFKEIYVLTYLFEAQTQKYYYDFYGIEYNYLNVKGDNPSNYEFTTDPISYQTYNYKSLIHILENTKLNQIGDLETALSYNWYKRNADNQLIKKLKNNCINFFKHYSQTQSDYNLWTTFKDYQSSIRGKGYSKCFLSSNARATNAYKDRTAVAYLVNRFFNPYIKNFFIENNVQVDEDAYAKSELLQFLFRSAIREGNEITVYIPSSRMRRLLKEWVEEVSLK